MRQCGRGKGECVGEGRESVGECVEEGRESVGEVRQCVGEGRESVGEAGGAWHSLVRNFQLFLRYTETDFVGRSPRHLFPDR